MFKYRRMQTKAFAALVVVLLIPALANAFLIGKRENSNPFPTFQAKWGGRQETTLVPLKSSPVMLEDLPLALDASATAISGSTTSIAESTLWSLRFISAVLSYVALVGFVDRPRGGQLQVNPETDIIVQPSSVPKAGLGLFSMRDLPKGTVLGTYPGVLLPINEGNLVKVQQYPYCETYIWRFSDNRFVLDPTNAVGELEPTCAGGSYAITGSQFLFSLPFFRGLFAQVPTTLCRVNEPPPGKDVNVVTEEDLKSRTVTFLLERDVMAGEELFIDYGPTYSRSTYAKVYDDAKVYEELEE